MCEVLDGLFELLDDGLPAGMGRVDVIPVELVGLRAQVVLRLAVLAPPSDRSTRSFEHEPIIQTTKFARDHL